MTESLFETYIRLKKNVLEATETFDNDPSATNASIRDLSIKAFTDFCIIFTENIMNAVGQTTDEVQFI